MKRGIYPYVTHMPPLLSFPLTLLSLIGYHQQTNLLSIFIVQINMVKYWNGACCLGVHFFDDEGCRPRSHFFKKRGTFYIRILCGGLDFEISLSSNLSLSHCFGLIWCFSFIHIWSSSATKNNQWVVLCYSINLKEYMTENNFRSVQFRGKVTAFSKKTTIFDNSLNHPIPVEPTRFVISPVDPHVFGFLEYRTVFN